MGASDPMADPIQPDEAIALGLVSTETPPADAHQRPSVEECENKCKQYWILTEPGKKREKTPKLGPKVSELLFLYFLKVLVNCLCNWKFFECKKIQKILD